MRYSCTEPKDLILSFVGKFLFNEYSCKHFSESEYFFKHFWVGETTSRVLSDAEKHNKTIARIQLHAFCVIPIYDEPEQQEFVPSGITVICEGKRLSSRRIWSSVEIANEGWTVGVAAVFIGSIFALLMTGT